MSVNGDHQSTAWQPSAGAPLRLQVSELEISMTRSRIDVVSEIFFEVASGQVMGLVGESGSGKTTVGLALLGHARRGLQITSGSVMLDGRDVLHLSVGELQALRGARAAYVPQDPASALNPMMRVGAQITEALAVHPDAAGSAQNIDRRVLEVLSEVNLPTEKDFLRRYPHQLSGGQQQRIALAMAFACRPGLIVLDEPTTGLDVTTQGHILETIARLAHTYGVAAVYVSHDLAVVGQIAQTVAVMYAGRIVEQGSTARVFAAPAHPYTELLMRAIPSLDRADALEGIDGQPPAPGERPAGCAFAARCPKVNAACLTSPPAVIEVAPGHTARCLYAARSAEAHAGRARDERSVEPSQQVALEIRELRARFGGNVVLHGVDLDVPSEMCVALVGESGSGKTTLARCLVGMHSQWEGRVSYRGTALARSARDRDKRDLQRIQYIFQNPYMSLNPRSTIGQLVAQPVAEFFTLSHGEIQRRVTAALEEVSLPASFITRYPDELSGGERQRVAIARALAAQPELLVCDEVSSALDVSVQAIIIELLKTLQVQRHLSMLFITHNLALVREIAQQVVVLSAGHVVEAGSVTEILEHPATTYTERLIADAPRLTIGRA